MKAERKLSTLMFSGKPFSEQNSIESKFEKVNKRMNSEQT